MLPTSWGELASLVGLISIVSSFLGAIAMLYLSSKFTTKKAHYHDKDEYWKSLHEAEDRISKLEKESELAKQPIVTMQKSFDTMKSEFEKLILAVNTMDKSVGTAIHAIDNRVSVLEATRTKRKA